MEILRKSLFKGCRTVSWDFNQGSVVHITVMGFLSINFFVPIFLYAMYRAFQWGPGHFFFPGYEERSLSDMEVLKYNAGIRQMKPMAGIFELRQKNEHPYTKELDPDHFHDVCFNYHIKKWREMRTGQTERIEPPPLPIVNIPQPFVPAPQQPTTYYPPPQQQIYSQPPPPPSPPVSLPTVNYSPPQVTGTQGYAPLSTY